MNDDIPVTPELLSVLAEYHDDLGTLKQVAVLRRHAGDSDYLLLFFEEGAVSYEVDDRLGGVVHSVCAHWRPLEVYPV